MTRDDARTRRRRRERAWTIEAGRKALAVRPVMMGAFTYRGIRAAYVTVEPDPAWPEPIVQAWRNRETANTTGRCPCGARVPLVAPAGKVTTVRMDHEGDCLVIDDNFLALIGRWSLGSRS